MTTMRRYETPRRLLLIGWDAADWKIISPMLDRGEMPHLERLVNRGVMGDVRTLRPVLSPMLWNSIATGHRPERHGILGFGEVDEATQTVRGVSSTSRQCKSLWNIVTQTGGRAHVVNWYASYPAEPIRGTCVSDAMSNQLAGSLPMGWIHSPAASEEFADLRMRPDEIDVSTLRLFVPRFAEVDQDNDTDLARIAQLLAESFTVHNAATRVMADEPWDLCAIYYPGIDHFCHGFMNFHPPRLPRVSARKFELYSEVVKGAYRLHDLFLGRLLELAGTDTSVILVSDHGFHSDHLRPRIIPHSDPVGAAVQHRDHGILVIAGEGIKLDERIYGAGLLDIAPTVLTMLGLPVGRDMPGRVLVDAFVQPPSVETIPSWDQEPGDDGRHAENDVVPAAGSLALEHLAALGYVDLQEIQGSRGPDDCRRESDWNLVQSLLDDGKVERAAERLFKLCERWPDRLDFGVTLAQSLRRLGHPREARHLFEAVVSQHASTADGKFLLGIAALDDRCYDEAIAHFQSIDEHAQRHDLQQRMGLAFLRVGKSTDAARAFERGIQVDPHDAVSWAGLARCAMRQKNWGLAERHAMHAIRIDFNRPWAHAILGAARLRSGRFEEADLALRVACRLAPTWIYPRRLRALLWARCSVGDCSAIDELKIVFAKRLQSRRRRKAYLTPARREMLRCLRAQYRDASGRVDVQSDGGQHSPLDLVVVSGLPRSGTSLMMQMLESGGVEVLADDQRTADDDNPRGYLEWEPIKQLPSRPELLLEADGKAVKIVSPLLPYLPRRHRYRVIFVDRPLDEVIASQLKMRANRSEASLPEVERLRQALAKHRDSILALLQRTPNVATLIVRYPDLIARPALWSSRVAEFLADRVTRTERMAAAVRPELYRNRSVDLCLPSKVPTSTT
jgi:predicted AlkP superfamily phosphohydrolase/phosphomutase/Flp pilus assembly protein TadD